MRAYKYILVFSAFCDQPKETEPFQYSTVFFLVLEDFVLDPCDFFPSFCQFSFRVAFILLFNPLNSFLDLKFHSYTCSSFHLEAPVGN